MNNKYKFKESIIIIIFFGLFFTQFTKKEYLVCVFVFLNIIVLFSNIVANTKNRMVFPLHIIVFTLNILLAIYSIFVKNYIVGIACVLVFLLDLKKLVNLESRSLHDFDNK